MNRLNKKVAAEQGGMENRAPVKVLQFGEGNFLRAFIDWMIDEMNGQGLFNGKVSVVQPLEYGMIDKLAEQDNLYTLLLRGVQDGEVVVRKKIIDVVERGVDVYAQFEAYLKEAENPDLRIIVSNTTEAGISLSMNDRSEDAPPISFPGKLLRLMKHRYDVFDGDRSKGFLLFPCELIDRNGDTLKAVLTELANAWYPEDPAFLSWLAERKKNWIDFNAGQVAEGKSLDEVCDAFAAEILAIASGTPACNEKNDYREIASIFDKVRAGKQVTVEEDEQFKTAMLLEFGRMDAEKGWTKQLHLGALRNANTRMLNQLGANTGFDSIGDWSYAEPLSRYLDTLNSENALPKTILYNLNPNDNEMLATMLGNFQDGSVAGKMQMGSGWWFLDQKYGMERQIEALSQLGSLSRFVGMLTDSRSFLSYTRHEYFRGILCNILGRDMVEGAVPYDFELVGRMVSDICYNNAADYFGFDVK